MSLVRSVFPMQGGLNTASPPLAIPPGATSACVNYEALAKGGYRRIDGYLLFDGTVDPDVPAAVPGSGPIRGVAVYEGDVYAFRDNAGGTAVDMYVSSLTGWTLVSLGRHLLFDAGTAEILEGDTLTGAISGCTATVERVMITSGLWGSGNAVGLLALSSVSTAFQNNETITSSGGGSATADGADVATTLPAAGEYDFVVHNFFGSSSTRRLYGANGVGYAFEFDGTTLTPIVTGSMNYPTHVEEFKNHLVLGYANGALDISATATPLVFAGELNATSVATGDEIQDMKELVGGVLAVAGRRDMHLLSGQDYQDFALDRLDGVASRGKTLTSIYTDSYVLTDQGVQIVSPVQEYGNFGSTAVSQFIEDQISRDIANTNTKLAITNRTKNQYRLFFGSTGYYFTFDGTRLVGIMPVAYSDEVLAVASGTDSSDNEVAYFGSTDGKVFKFDTGYNFNGTSILSTLQLPFMLENAGQMRKRLRRVIMNIMVNGAQPTLLLKADFKAYDAETTATQQRQMFLSGDSGVLWDTALWDTADWGDAGLDGQAQVRMDGVGQHIIITIFNDGTHAGAYTLYSTTLLWQPRRLLRGE